MRLLLLMSAALVLAACSSAPKPPKEVVVTVRGTCVPMNVPPRPDPNSYPDTRDKLLGMNEGPQRYAALLAGNLLRKDRLEVIEPVVEACR